MGVWSFRKSLLLGGLYHGLHDDGMVCEARDKAQSHSHQINIEVC